MSRRSTSLNNITGTAITREIDSKYDNVKIVADSITQVENVSDSITAGDLIGANAIAGMTAAQGAEGTQPSWNSLTGVLTIPKGDTGSTGVSVTGVTRTIGTGLPGATDTFTVTFSNATTSTYQVTNGSNGTNGTNGMSPDVAFSVDINGNLQYEVIGWIAV